MNIKTIFYASIALILIIVSTEAITMMLTEADSITNLLAIPVIGITIYLLLKLFKNIKK
jgi:hypothetical protein